MAKERSERKREEMEDIWKNDIRKEYRSKLRKKKEQMNM
jgi:hypothetical protein